MFLGTFWRGPELFPPIKGAELKLFLTVKKKSGEFFDDKNGGLVFLVLKTLFSYSFSYSALDVNNIWH